MKRALQLDFAGAQLELHYTLALVLLGFCAASPGRWLGVLVVWGVHLGATLLALRRAGGRAARVRITAARAWVGAKETLGVARLALVAWSGLTGQAALLLVWLGSRWVTGFPPGRLWSGLDEAIVHANLSMLVVSLVPWPGSGGEEAWSLLRRARWAHWEESEPGAGVPLAPEEARRREETERVFQKMLDELQRPRAEQPEEDE